MIRVNSSNELWATAPPIHQHTATTSMQHWAIGSSTFLGHIAQRAKVRKQIQIYVKQIILFIWIIVIYLCFYIIIMVFSCSRARLVACSYRDMTTGAASKQRLAPVSERWLEKLSTCKMGKHMLWLRWIGEGVMCSSCWVDDDSCFKFECDVLVYHIAWCRLNESLRCELIMSVLMQRNSRVVNRKSNIWIFSLFLSYSFWTLFIRLTRMNIYSEQIPIRKSNKNYSIESHGIHHWNSWRISITTLRYYLLPLSTSLSLVDLIFKITEY